MLPWLAQPPIATSWPCVAAPHGAAGEVGGEGWCLPPPQWHCSGDENGGCEHVALVFACEQLNTTLGGAGRNCWTEEAVSSRA